MPYIFLSLALLAVAVKGYSGKKVSGYITGYKDAVLATAIRMCLCVIIGLVIVLLSGQGAQLAPTLPLILISALSGTAMVGHTICWLMSVRKSAYMLMDVFMMLGLLIPLLLSYILFSEAIRPTQWLGLALLLIATLIMCSYNNTIKTRLTLGSVALLLICGISNGTVSFSQKLFVKELPEISASVYNFYSYVFSALILVITFLVMSIKNKDKPEGATFKKISFHIVIMAVCLFANSLLLTLAADRLDSIILFPLNQGMTLIISTAMSAVFFKERFTLKCAMGILIAFIGLIVINFL